MPPIDPFTLEQMTGAPGDVHAGGPRSCPKCGYDMRGTPMSRPCPECGWFPQGSHIGEALEQPEGTPCVKCGEPIVGMVLGAMCPKCAVGQDRRVTDRDICGACGYNLKGLGASPTCPECGEGRHTGTGQQGGGSSSSPSRRQVQLPQFTTAIQTSRIWQLGLALLVAVSGLWAVLCVSRTIGFIDHDEWSYVLQGSAIGLAIACVLATPGRADGPARNWLLPIRWLARLMILGLLLGAKPWNSPWAEAAFAFIGLVGLTMFLWILAMYARTNESQRVSRRFELGWIFAIPCGVVSYLLPFPGKVANLPQDVGGYIVVFIMLLMLIPTFVLCWYIFRPSLTLLHESIWASQNARHQQHVDRSRQVQSACRSCGYPLRGLDRTSLCPECGSKP